MKRKKYRLNKKKFANFLGTVFAAALAGGIFSTMFYLLLTAPPEARF